jgi:hypothetical protein
MAQNASDSQKVDYLWKKIVYGAAKTDISGNIDATNEPNPSPLQIRADKILQDSASIPGVIPGSNSSVVTVYPTAFPVECISTAAIPTPTLTWQTGRTFWVPPEFGSTYQIKVYIAPSGNAANVASKGTQVFATGSGFNDLWVFDYQAGILNFNSNNTPYSGGAPISFTGNSVYISGAVYAGAFGLPNNSNIAGAILGNVTFSNVTVSTSITSANLILSPSGVGAVQVAGTGALGLPHGTIAQRPTAPAIGYIRFNTEVGEIESWDGTGWVTPGQAVITSDIINPDGASNVYTLSSNATSTGVMVSINGTIQQPYTAYTIINNNQIQFTETPLTSDIIDVRHMASSATTISYLQAGPTSVTLDGVANVNVANNLVVSNDIYFVGNLYQNGNLFSSGAVNQTYFTSSNLVTTATTLIDSILITGNVGVLWTTTSIDNANNNYKSSLINSVNDGANVFYNESSIVKNNSNVAVATFTSNIVGGNLKLWAVGDSSNVTVSFQRTLLGKQTPFGYVSSGPRGFVGATGPAGTIGNTSSVIQSTNATPSTSTSTGGLIVTGGAGIGGNLNVGGTYNTIGGHLLPSANIAYDLGSPTLRWRTGYFSASTLDIGGAQIGSSTAGFTFTVGGVTQTLFANGISTANTFTASQVSIQGNLALQSGLLAQGTLGASGQILQTTGTGVQWVSAAQSTIFSGNAGIIVNTNQKFVNVYVDNTTVASFSTGANVNQQYALRVTNALAATSPITGAFVVDGGIGANGNVYVGSILSVTGATTLTTLSVTSINTSGNILASGGILNALTVNGDVTVTGAITSVLTNNLISGNVKAPIIGNTGATVTGTLAQFGNVNAVFIGNVGASFIGASLNVTGNVIASAITGSSLNINGLINTTGNLLASTINATTLTISGTGGGGYIAASTAIFGNISAGTIGNVGAVHTGASLNVTGNVLAATIIGSTATISGNTYVGSLGIGTTTYGNIGELRATNNITAYYSDERLKTRLGAIENALDKVDQLSGFYHEANELAQSLGYNVVREVGVSAQEVQRVLPEIVAPAPIDPQYLTVRYERLTPLLIEAIKELRQEVNAIKEQINKNS